MPPPPPPPARILLIAGSDSSGGAGLEADQKVIAAHGCYAMTATTALTAQNTLGVSDIHLIPPPFVRKQIKACFEDIGVDVVKTGMLASAETIETVADALREQPDVRIVLDPVMVATTGAKLLPPEALGALRQRLLPLATILTPNVPEAQLLLDDGSGDLSRDIKNVDDLESLAVSLYRLGSKWVLLKGGHAPLNSQYQVAHSDEEKKLVVDILCGKDGVTRIETPYVATKNTHGTGCSLASAIASNLAKGAQVEDAVRSAIRYVEAAIKTAPGLGKGNGPLNHFHSTYSLPFAPGHFVEWLLARPEVQEVWTQYICHPFVLAMGNGTLPLDSFKGYLVQDYLFLIQFARANALAAYKTKDIRDIAKSATMVSSTQQETKLHLEYCQSFDIAQDEIESTEEHVACTAYTRYVLDVGQSEDYLALQVALAPCLLGYGALAVMLQSHPDTVRHDNRYWKWVENYTGDDYVQAVRTGSELLEKYAVLASPTRLGELVKIFVHATKMEIAFWEMFPSK